jgi:hypothetical protein
MWMKRRLILVIFVLVFSSSCLGPEERRDKARYPNPLSKQLHFSVLPIVMGLDYQAILKSMTKDLEEIGHVYLFPTKGAGDRAAINLWMGPIAQEPRESAKAKQCFPVLWISLEVVDRIEVARNHSETTCVIWKKQLFLEQDPNKQIAEIKVKLAIKALLEQFANDYKMANPTTTPNFYIDTI